MCGLAGFWSVDGRTRDLEAIAAAMADRIRHRGPDDGGTWVDPVSGLAFAHRRLSIIDLSPAGHQPMVSASGRWVLVYNGEVYNHTLVRSELEAAGLAPAWHGHSDTETLLAAIESWGLDATLKRCVGMFALALWDRRDRQLWLARDRLGEKPLYYGWQRGSFLFGSELKALRMHPDFAADVDRDAVADLLRHNYIPGPASIYQGILKLPPGTWLRVDRGNRDAAPVCYWSLAEVAERGQASPFAGSDAEALAGLRDRLSSSVRGQMMSDVPLGALLSGGVDSSLVTALMQANSTRPVRTFTIGFDEPRFDESAAASAVAAHLGTEHTALRLSGSDALALVDRLPEMYDEPFADSSQLPTYLVMRLARQHVTVALSGDGGDEFFGGYNRYFLGPKVWSAIGWMPRPVRSAIGRALTGFSADAIDRALGPLSRGLGVAQPGGKAHKLGTRMQEAASLDDLYVSLVSEWPRSGGVALGCHPAASLLDQRERWPRLGDPVARMMAMDGLTYLPDDILAKVDRASMAVSLETRAPFLDRDVVEYAWTLPMAMKLRDGRGKWLLRRLLDDYVPRPLIDRPKMGFGIPLDEWLRGPLRDWCEALLSEARLRREGFLDPAPVRAAWRAHLAGASNGYRLWSILMFQAWLERNGAPTGIASSGVAA